MVDWDLRSFDIQRVQNLDISLGDRPWKRRRQSTLEDVQSVSGGIPLESELGLRDQLLDNRPSISFAHDKATLAAEYRDVLIVAYSPSRE